MLPSFYRWVQLMIFETNFFPNSFVYSKLHTLYSPQAVKTSVESVFGACVVAVKHEIVGDVQVIENKCTSYEKIAHVLK
jgi:hypothetical protein